MIFSSSIPDARPADIIGWADASGLKVDGHSFDSTRTPQLIEPIRAMADADTRIGTLIKPVQVGGSTAGEIVSAYWAAFLNGLIQYNWQDDLKAKDRWTDRILPMLESCRDIKRGGGRYEELLCVAHYVNTTVRVQGVFNESALDSDTVPLQINEEVHLWKPGFLGKARRRQTQVWNAKAFDISNASNKNDQLHFAFEDGTQEHWQVICPGCGKQHEMRFRFNKAKPELGGLRWDSDGCKMDGGRFNYNKLERTIRYQMPCGYEIRDHASERRRLKGSYSEPKNEGAHVSHRSWTFDAVSCDSIRWLTLIQEWHSAIRAIKTGDDEPMRRFVTERETAFYDADEHRPFQGQIIIRTGIKKSRAGLPGRVARLWAADKQKGYRHKGELGHYWLVIRDVMENCDSQLVFEGMVQTDTDLIALLDDHECKRHCGCVDGTWDARNVEEFCYRNNLNMIMGSPKQEWFFHKKTKTRHFYSEPEPLHMRLKMPYKFGYTYSVGGVIPQPQEPVVWFYNKAGLIDNLLFLRNHRSNVERAAQGENPPRIALPHEYIAHDVPEDVSEDYKLQNDSWTLRPGNRGRSKEAIEEWRQTRKDDHMLLCEGYIANMMHMEGFIANRLAQLGVVEQTEARRN